MLRNDATKRSCQPEHPGRADLRHEANVVCRPIQRLRRVPYTQRDQSLLKSPPAPSELRPRSTVPRVVRTIAPMHASRDLPITFLS